MGPDEIRRKMKTKLYYPIFVFVLLALALVGCAGSPANGGSTQPTQAPASVPADVQKMLDAACGNDGVVEYLVIDGVRYDCPTQVGDPNPTQPAATEAPAMNLDTAKFDHDLFDRGNGLCFVVEWEPVRGMHRVLEFLYGVEIDKAAGSLIEVEPTSRGVDERTWPGRTLLVNAETNRATNCGEVEARRPILYRIDPSEDLVTQFTFVMDNVDNPDYEAAYDTQSVDTNGVGLFIGSEKGVDVRLRIYDADGKLIDEQYHHVAGAYCNDCYAGTNIVGPKQQYAESPDSVSFIDSERVALTTDVLILELPEDFIGTYEVTLGTQAGHETMLFLGALNPNSQ
jgi:hypothetical protein